jgi:hypothetical protein
MTSTCGDFFYLTGTKIQRICRKAAGQIAGSQLSIRVRAPAEQATSVCYCANMTSANGHLRDASQGLKMSLCGAGHRQEGKRQCDKITMRVFHVQFAIP